MAQSELSITINGVEVFSDVDFSDGGNPLESLFSMAGLVQDAVEEFDKALDAIGPATEIVLALALAAVIEKTSGENSAITLAKLVRQSIAHIAD